MTTSGWFIIIGSFLGLCLGLYLLNEAYEGLMRVLNKDEEDDEDEDDQIICFTENGDVYGC